MAFGPRMQLDVGDLKIELAPLSQEVLSEFVSPGLQQASVTKYLNSTTAPVLEDEHEWFEKTRLAEDTITWGIYVRDGEKRLLIGNTSLTDITKGHTIQAVSGSMIFRKDYWGKGIASTIHKARTWYVFDQLGFTRVKSAVIHGNVASRKALEKSGYRLVYVERNTAFIDGQLRHQDNLECINPSQTAWSLWWGHDTPPTDAVDARNCTLDAMAWAKEHVTLL